MPNINKNIIMQAGAAVANATNKAAGLSASTPKPGGIISAIQLVNGGRTIGPAALAHFTESVRNKLLSLLVSMEPIQSGSGTPSPNNVRPINGRTGLSVYVGPTQDHDDATTYAVDWTSEAGTVYGGTLDVVSGLLTVTMAEVTLKGTESFTLSNASGNNPRRFMRSASALGIATPADNDERDISTHFKYQKTATVTEAFGTFRLSSYLTFPDANSEFADATAFNNWLATQKTNGTPVKIAYILATPLTYQLTPQDIITLVGYNYIWSDSGDVTITE